MLLPFELDPNNSPRLVCLHKVAKKLQFVTFSASIIPKYKKNSTTLGLFQLCRQNILTLFQIFVHTAQKIKANCRNLQFALIKIIDNLHRLWHIKVRWIPVLYNKSLF